MPAQRKPAAPPARARRAPSPHIGVRQESALHAALKAWYAEPGDLVETPVDGYLVDIARGGLLIEIQTRNFSALRAKLAALTAGHAVRVVYPVAAEKWIVRLAPDERTVVSRRRSPKRGRALDVFAELPSIARLLALPNLSVEVVLVRAEEVLCTTRGPRRASWRRKGWRIHDRRLLEVVGRQALDSPGDFLAFLPESWRAQTLAQPGIVREPRAEYAADAPAFTFTSSELAAALRVSPSFARKMTYSLREMGAIRAEGKRGRAVLYGIAK
jgi:hypothetical protein